MNCYVDIIVVLIIIFIQMVSSAFENDYVFKNFSLERGAS